jgi:guanylate kinase
MESKGKLILIGGFSGAGKTTLARAALEQFPSLRYLTTYTTRPMREHEKAQGSFEYTFVDDAEYSRLRSANDWDHGEYAGYSYGANITEAKAYLQQGGSYVCCIVPDIETIKRQHEIFGSETVLIWVDTPLEVANQRLLADPDESRRKRQQNPLQKSAIADEIKQIADYVFVPSEAIEDTIASFTVLLHQVLS